MAKKLGLPLGKYLKIEAGCKVPSPELVEKMAKIMEIDENMFNKVMSHKAGIDKKLRKYRGFIKLLEENPEIEKAVNEFSKRSKIYKHIKLGRLMRKIIKILKDENKSGMFYDIVDFCSR